MGSPSGVRMSQNIRAVPWWSPRHGSTANVDGSGLTSMSASYTRARPSIAEPSNPMPFGEGTLELGRGDSHGLQRAEDVGEPEPDEPDVALLDGAEHELLLPVHGVPSVLVRLHFTVWGVHVSRLHSHGTTETRSDVRFITLSE